MNKKKICLVSPKAYPLLQKKTTDTSGGAELQTAFLAKELARNYIQQYDVSIIVEDNSEPHVEKIDNITIYKCVNKKYFKFIDCFIKIKKINPDIIYKRALGYQFVVAIYKIFNNKVKYIHHIANEKDINGDRYKNIAGRICQFSLYYLVDTILVQTKDQYELLQNKLQKKVPKNGIIRNIFPIKNYNIKKEKKVILWVARCVSFKQPEKFLDLAKKFSQEKFVMICPKENIDLWKKVKKIADNLDNVEFIERVPFQKIHTYFEKAKIFINTSAYEGYPNTFLQAAATGTPIISLSVNPDNLLEKENIGYYCNDSEKQLYKKTKNLLMDNVAYNKISQSGILYLEKHHSVDNIMENFTYILNQK